MFVIILGKTSDVIGPFDSTEKIDDYFKEKGITKQQFDPDIEDFWYKDKDGKLITILIRELLPPNRRQAERHADPQGQRLCEL
jgi:hypothetical protein